MGGCRVTILMCNTSTGPDLHLHQIFSKYLKWYEAQKTVQCDPMVILSGEASHKCHLYFPAYSGSGTWEEDFVCLNWVTWPSGHLEMRKWQFLKKKKKNVPSSPEIFIWNLKKLVKDFRWSCCLKLNSNDFCWVCSSITTPSWLMQIKWTYLFQCRLVSEQSCSHMSILLSVLSCLC